MHAPPTENRSASPKRGTDVGLIEVALHVDLVVAREGDFSGERRGTTSLPTPRLEWGAGMGRAGSHTAECVCAHDGPRPLPPRAAVEHEV